MPKAETPQAQYMRQLFPPPSPPPCPQNFYHHGTPYMAARSNGNRQRFGQYNWICFPPKAATEAEKLLRCKPMWGPVPSEVEQERGRALFVKFQEDNPKPKRETAPKKKTPVQLAVDAVVAAINTAFPGGVAGPPTDAKCNAVDKAIAVLNQLCPLAIDQTVGPTNYTLSEVGKGKGKARGEPEVPNVTGDCTMLRFARTVKEDASSSDEDDSVDVQVDGYDSDLYEIAPRLLVQVVIYTAANQEPVEQQLRLRSKSNFQFTYFPIAKAIRAVAEGDDPFCVEFLRFSLSSLKFTSDRVLETLNLTGRGNIVLYRAKFLRNEQCPGINTWMARACAAAYPGGLFMEEDDEDDREHHPSTPGGPRSSLPSASSSTGLASSSRHLSTSPLKRKLRSEGSAGSSGSFFLDEQTALLDDEDREDRRLRKFTRPLEKDEHILVSDSSDEDV